MHGAFLAEVVGLLGVLKAGGGYLPLDPEHPAGRWAYMLSDSRVQVVLDRAATGGRGTQPRSAGSLAGEGGAGPRLPGRAMRQSRAECVPRIPPYVIYTSGSTGEPKGVVITHQSLANYIWWSRKCI